MLRGIKVLLAASLCSLAAFSLAVQQKLTVKYEGQTVGTGEYTVRMEPTARVDMVLRMDFGGQKITFTVQSTYDRNGRPQTERYISDVMGQSGT